MFFHSKKYYNDGATFKTTQTQHVVESTGVFNNHQTYFWIFSSSNTDRQTAPPVEVPPVLKKIECSLL